ncbi:hypothetical protein [Chryseobacterium luquanense]|uniref:DUF4238 domain-containing protein n=1 Tax=Chryseobacterium luquanense TaxID=2983766 RepID=A0ABT3Y712_9FLAO|nr:hypothetical protein [Chryseobacterium luquanense]MCX8533935.1 hypothetical protein [Chryseobacterium luquanense]
MATLYDQFKIILEKYSSENKIQILHRGFTKDYSFKKFNLDVNYNTLEQFGERLFFFGEKSKNFEFKKNNLKFKINDTSSETFERIFNIFGELENDNIPQEYYLKNEKKINYFTQENKIDFLEKVQNLHENCKIYLRNYYFTVLHQLDYNDFKDVSLMVSSSIENKVAESFSNKSGIKINFWKWNSETDVCNLADLPIFEGVPHPYEKEETIFGAIFPHYIYSFESEGKIFINPNIEELEDYEVLLYAGFDIDQSNFKEKLEIMTSYQTYLENNNGKLEEF